MKSDGIYTILILGANTMQLPAIRIAKEKGWRVVAADRNSEAPGVKSADFFENVDLKDKSGMLEAARKYDRLYTLDGVFTAGTDFSDTVAFVAEKMDLPGISYETALKASDKSMMRRAFREHGIPSPGFMELTRPRELEQAGEMNFPLVVKPVDNMGARGVRRVDNREELTDAFGKAIRASRTSRVIVEEFIEGPEFSIDALVYDGEIRICGVADRHIHFPPYFVELGHTIPTEISVKNLMWLIEVFKAGVRALGIDCGAAKGDIFLTEEGPCVGEIAARLSGGYMSGWTYPYSSGFRVTGAALEIAVGLSPRIPQQEELYYSAERAFISVPGVVESFAGEETVRESRGIMELFTITSPGDRVVFPTNNVEKCGNIISRCRTREEAVEAAEKAVKQITIRLGADDKVTGDFLFGPRGPGQNIFPPQAYSIHDDRLLQVYRLMSPYRGEPESSSGVSIIPFPGIENEKIIDWNKNTIMESIEKIKNISGAGFSPGENPSELQLGKIFWKALFRGGYQGGLFIIDTVKLYMDKREILKNRLDEWVGLL